MFFEGKARRADYGPGYARYLSRCVKTPKDRVLDDKAYGKVIQAYCQHLADTLENQGIIDLPSGMGSIVAVRIRLKPQYNKAMGKWFTKGTNPHSFGFIYTPRREKGYENLRCYGYRANRRLYDRMRKKYDDGTLPFYLFDSEIYV